MIDGFDHVGTDHICNVCQRDFTDDEGGIQGYLGILPVAFCPTCFCGLCDMAEQVNDREWEGMTDDEIKECWDGDLSPYQMQCIREIESKLREKNK